MWTPDSRVPSYFIRMKVGSAGQDIQLVLPRKACIRGQSQVVDIITHSLAAWMIINTL